MESQTHNQEGKGHCLNNHSSALLEYLAQRVFLLQPVHVANQLFNSREMLNCAQYSQQPSVISEG